MRATRFCKKCWCEIKKTYSDENICKPCFNKRSVEYGKKHRKEQREKNEKKFIKENTKRHNEWVNRNNERWLEYQREYQKEYWKDPVRYEAHRLRVCLRGVLNSTINGSTKNRTNRVMPHVGCSREELVHHLEQTSKQPFRMWKKFLNGELEIDHIVPLKEANTIEQVHALFHYTNLRLIEKKINRVGRPRQ